MVFQRQEENARNTGFMRGLSMLKKDNKKKTFLISAYACEPGEGSEPGVGWNWTVELAKKHNVIVITRENNRGKIEAEYSKEKYPNLIFYYCDVPRYLSFWKKGQRGVHLYYFLWQIYCYKLAKKIVKAYSVDYTLAVTFGNIWMPSFMYKLPCKFIWGPLGGGEGVPKELWTHLSAKQRIIERIRHVNMRFPLTNPWKTIAIKKAYLIIVRTKDTLACIPERYQSKCQLEIETGISQQDIDFFKIVEENKNPEFKNDFLICGKMVPYKMFALAIDAFGNATEINQTSKLHIVGDGPMMRRLQSNAQKYGSSANIIFHGKKSREETLKIMASCKALLLTSAREGGSWVMFEAMLLRKPIICFDTSGMSVVVNSETGCMIPVCKYESAVKQFAAQMENCDDALCQKKGHLAYQRVITRFTWKAKVEQMNDRLCEIDSNTTE